MRLFIFLLFIISSSIAQNTVRDKLSIKYNIERDLINGAILDSLSSVYPSDDSLKVSALLLDSSLSKTTLLERLKLIATERHSEIAYVTLIGKLIDLHQKDSVLLWNNKLLFEIPNSENGLLVKAWNYYEVEQYPRTIAIINSIKALHGESVRAKSLKGLAYLRLKNRSSASILFEEVLIEDSLNRNAIIGLIEIYIEVKAYVKVIDLSNKLLAKDSMDTYLLATAAKAYSLTKQHNKSISYYKKVIKLRPTDINVLEGLSRGYHSIENMDSLCKYQQMIIKLKLDSKENSSELTELKSQYTAYCDNSKAAYYYQRGIASYNLGQYENSIDHYNSGIKKFPNNFYCWNFKGNTYMSLNNYNEAIKAYDRSIQILKQNNFKIDNIPEQMKEQELLLIGMSYYSAAECYAHLGNKEKMLEYFNNFEQQFGEGTSYNKVSKLNALGILSILQNDYSTAFTHFIKKYEVSKFVQQDYEDGLGLAAKIYQVNTNTPQKIYRLLITVQDKQNPLIQKEGTYKISQKTTPIVPINKAFEIVNELIITYPKRIEAYILLAFLNKEFNRPYCADIRSLHTLGYPLLDDPFWEHCK
tara:strand:- start:85 stop:1842 length:1758 start_codon:yes stop_codon:yes gene_type:complete